MIYAKEQETFVVPAVISEWKYILGKPLKQLRRRSHTSGAGGSRALAGCSGFAGRPVETNLAQRDLHIMMVQQTASACVRSRIEAHACAGICGSVSPLLSALQVTLPWPLCSPFM
jgi:hypothetical protein